MDPRIGTELPGYRIEALLGRGGMSVVYRAQDLGLERRVALKLIAPELAEDARFRERFLKESKIAASIDHANVIPIYDAGETDGLLYIAMRYVEGTDLKTLLEREGPLEPARALSILGQVASALDTARFSHGLVHRDVKPGNILLVSERGPEPDSDSIEHVYLSDFGLSKHAADERSLTEGGQFLGTMDYVAPEQIEDGPVDGRADVYSLGCVLYQCLTGSAPYRKDSKTALLWAHLQEPPPTVTGLRGDLPAGIDTVVARALAKSPEERYPTCRELVADARLELQAGAGEHPPAPASFGPLRSRRARVIAAVAALLVIAAAAAIPSILLSGDGKEAASAEPAAPIRHGDLVERFELVSTDPSTAGWPVDIEVGDNPNGLAVGAGAIWVANQGDGTVSEIDPETNTVVRTTDVGGSPSGIAFDPDRGTVWVATGGFNGTVVQIRRGAGDRVSTRRFDLKVNPGGFGADVAVGEGSVWVASFSPDTVLRLDPLTGKLLATIGVGFHPWGLAIGEGAVWVVNDGDSTVSRIDPATNRVTATIRVGTNASDVAVGEGAVWVGNHVDNTVSRIDPKTNRVTTKIKVGRGPGGVAVGGGSVWVVNHGEGTVYQIDPATNVVVDTIGVGRAPAAIAVGEGSLWVTFVGAND